MSPMAALDPAGPFAAPLADISWVLFVVTGIVTLVVIVALGLAVFAPPQLRRLIADKRAVVIGGLAFPVVVLSALLVYGLMVTAKVAAPPSADALRIRVHGDMWWWRVAYLDGDETLFETANEIRIPVGRPVAFELQSGDVIHSFWVPQLGPKMDMIPGRTNVVTLQADRAGVFRGQCAEYCGAAHALMAFEVVAEEPAAFNAWALQQAAPTQADLTGDGWRAFAGSGCGACHTIRGAEANGRLGPDLTHLAGRRTLAAGIVANDAATRMRFLQHPEELKPGVRMPGYASLPAAELEALNEWLGTLR